MPGILEYSIAIITGVILFFGVLRPAWRMRGISLPSEAEWTEVAERIVEIRRDFVDEDTFHPTTKQALKLMLGREPGYGRLTYLPLALDTIQGSADFVARTYRALSSQAIIVGLLGTVATFFTLFLSENLARQGTPAAAQEVAQRVLAHLTIIYLVNAVAIGIASWLYHLSWKAKHAGELAALAASSAFSRLAEGGEASLAPELAAALDRSAEQFRGFSESLFNGQFQRLESLLGQIEGLGKAMRELVREVVAQNQRDQGVFQAQLRETSTSIERVTQRMDEGFKLLAQPFLQGIPAMQSLAESADGLKSAADSVLKANVVVTTTQLKIAASALDRTVKEMPELIRAALEQATGSVRESSQQGVELGVRSALEPVMRDWAAAAKALETTVVEPLGTHLAEGAASLAALNKAISDFSRADAERTDQVGKNIEVTADHLASEVRRAIV